MNQPNISEKLCPVCGYELGFTPWESGVQSEAICPCCGIHFGSDDQVEALRWQKYIAWRRRWINDGKKWWSNEPVPADFDPNEQLARLERLADEQSER